MTRGSEAPHPSNPSVRGTIPILTRPRGSLEALLSVVMGSEPANLSLIGRCSRVSSWPRRCCLCSDCCLRVQPAVLPPMGGLLPYLCVAPTEVHRPRGREHDSFESRPVHLAVAFSNPGYQWLVTLEMDVRGERCDRELEAKLAKTSSRSCNGCDRKAYV